MLSWWFLLWNLVMVIMLASDVVVLGVVGSPALVTTYTLAKYLPQAIIVAVATLIVAIMPGQGGRLPLGALPADRGARSDLLDRRVRWGHRPLRRRLRVLGSTTASLTVSVDGPGDQREHATRVHV